MASKKQMGAQPNILLCEGKTDRHFFERFLEAHKLDEVFDVHEMEYTNGKGKVTKGITALGGWLVSASADPKYRRKSSILIIVDSDDDPEKALRTARSQSVEAGKKTRGLTLPTQSLASVPRNRPGSLETLCIEALYEKWPDVKQPLEVYASATGVDEWTSLSQQDKMRVHAAIAAKCRGRSNCPLGELLTMGTAGLDPDHAVFHDLIQLLKQKQ
ncbi:MAG: hypothetical protein JSS72_12660 [Armatimonadetes bacterium]|nr:hypothetical protein [Armatimonadota bacterium]